MSDTLLDADFGFDRAAPPVATRSMSAIGTTATVAVTAAGRADEALAVMSDELRAIDEACSRFRRDSELREVERRSGGEPVEVSPLLFDVLEVACAMAVKTAGIVDPTIGSALIELGYDHDFEEIADRELTSDHRPQPAPGWWQIALDHANQTVAIPAGVHVDLGATAKAFVADRSARRIAAALDCGALVNLGGDVAVAGPGPTAGWAVGIARDCTAPVDAVDQVVTLFDGGLATSGTTARSWACNGRRVHHIIDPWTGDSAPVVWSLVSIMATSCVEANAWSTAAIVWGHDAIGNLSALGLPARLVTAGGDTVRLGDWPADSADPLGARQVRGSVGR